MKLFLLYIAVLFELHLFILVTLKTLTVWGRWSLQWLNFIKGRSNRQFRKKEKVSFVVWWSGYSWSGWNCIALCCMTAQYWLVKSINTKVIIMKYFTVWVLVFAIPAFFLFFDECLGKETSVCTFWRRLRLRFQLDRQDQTNRTLTIPLFSYMSPYWDFFSKVRGSAALNLLATSTIVHAYL